MKELLYSFEGCDGSGKSTLSKAVYNALKEAQEPVLLLREPDALREDIMRLIASKNTPKETIFYLFMADRAYNQPLIQSYLNKGYIVLLDRYIDSTYAYQGFGQGIPLTLINSLNQRFIQPHKTFFLDLPVSQSWSRIQDKKKDSFELEGLNYQKTIYAGYKSAAIYHSYRFQILDGTLPLDALVQEVKDTILTHKYV